MNTSDIRAVNPFDYRLSHTAAGRRSSMPTDLNSSLHEISSAGDILSGSKALSRAKRLQNNGAVKKLFNGYIKNKRATTNQVPYDKKEFIPFVDERDHLGQLIDSDVRTELGGQNYIKKLVIFRPRKHSTKIEVRDDIPRRWIERVGNLTEKGSPRYAGFSRTLPFDQVSAFNNSEQAAVNHQAAFSQMNRYDVSSNGARPGRLVSELRVIKSINCGLLL